MYQRPKFLPAGDKALSVEVGDTISPEINRRVHNIFLTIQNRGIPGVIELVPTYRSLLVYYDPLLVSLPALEEQLTALEQHLDETPLPAPKSVEVPTLYGGEHGPDLDYVAEYNRLRPQEVIHIHSGTDYLVYAMGFTPGFPYLGGMSEKIATPRLQTPRIVIPAGSVGIAEGQTGIYPIESPGGWRLIGRTPVQLFDPRRDPPVLVGPGDYVRFVHVTESTYHDIRRRLQAGSYRLSIHAVQ